MKYKSKTKTALIKELNSLRRKVNSLEKDKNKLKGKSESTLKTPMHGLNEAQRLAHIGNWELDLEKNVLYWSDEIYRIFEIDPKKFGASYEAFLNAIHPNDREAVSAAYSYSLENKSPYSIDHRLLFSDGRIKYVHEECETFYDEKGKPIRSVGTVQDITERKAYEQALLSSSLYTRGLIETSLDPLVTIGPDGKITDVNKATETITGKSREKLNGTDFSDYFTEPEKAKAGYQEVFEKGFVRDYPLETHRKNGQVFSVLYNASLYRDEHGKVVGVFAAARDVTERKKAEEELHEREKHSRSLLRLSKQFELAQTYADVLNAAYAEVKSTLGYQSLWVYLLSEDKKYFKALIAGGPISQTVLSEEGTATLTIAGNRMLEEIADAKEIIVVEDAPRDARTNKEIVKSLGNRTIVNVPIFLFNKHLGSVGTGTFGEEGVRVPTRLEQEFLIAMASHLAVALDRIHLLDERKRSEEALRQLNRELRAISNCNQTLLRVTDEQTLLNEICRIICDEAGYRTAWVGYAENDEAKTVRPVAWAGFNGGYITNAKISWSDTTERGQGPSGKAIRSGEIVYVNDFRTDPQVGPWRESALQRGYESSIALPLKDEDAKVFGVLQIYSAEANAITSDEVKLLQELANDLAFGITALRTRAERALHEQAIAGLNRVYKVLSKTNELIVREKNREHLLQEICRIAVEDGGLLMASVSFVDKKKHLVVPYTWSGKEEGYFLATTISVDDIPEGKGPTGTAIRENRFVFSTDIATESMMMPWREPALKRGYRSSAAFPLREKGKPFGAFTLFAAENAFFNDDELALMNELAMDASYALENLKTEELRKLALKELQESEERFRRLAENARDVIYRMSLPDGNYEYISPAALSVFGYSPEEFYNTPTLLKQAIHPDWQRYFEEQWINLVEGKMPPTYEYQIIHKSGEVRWLNQRNILVHDNAGNPIAIEGIVTDITERKLAENELGKLSEAVAQSPASIVITNLNGNIEYVNKTFEETTGYTFEEVLNQNLKIIQSGLTPNEVYKDFWNTIKSGQVWKGEFLNKKKSGELYWENEVITPILDKNKRVINYLTIKQDITEKKKMTEELIEAKDRAEKSDKLKTEFLQQMSHEIRSPMNAVIGLSNLIKEEVSDKVAPDILEYFEGIDLAGNRLIRTVDLILNTSEMYVGTYEPIFTEIDIFEEVLKHLKVEFRSLVTMKGLEFLLSCNVSKPRVICDRYSVSQIFSNLIDNAIKYTHHGKVETRVDRNSNNNIKVTVEDTGIGISGEFMSKLFEPFTQEERGYSRRFEGNGLGLTLVKKYCDINKA
ncbi:MAG: PAS domain S-box protein, partial [Bacteroidetes bacterium]|nr:PAS domain S-box protein [Bacteroidota bacterium]